MDVRYKHAVTVLFMSRVGYEHREAAMVDLKRFVPEAELPENMFYFTWPSCPRRDVEGKLRQEGM
jgi:salicylate hydroxylase